MGSEVDRVERYAGAGGLLIYVSKEFGKVYLGKAKLSSSCRQSDVTGQL